MNLEVKNNYSPRRTMRMMVIMIVYSYEVLGQKPDLNQIFENDEMLEWFDYKNVFKDKKKVEKEQFQIIGSIEKNYDFLIKLIDKYIRQDWIWERMNALLRSILLCALVELWKLDIGIVANEYVEITKDFFPETDEYKFVNKVVQEVGREYVEYKKNQKTNN